MARLILVYTVQPNSNYLLSFTTSRGPRSKFCGLNLLRSPRELRELHKEYQTKVLFLQGVKFIRLSKTILALNLEGIGLFFFVFLWAATPLDGKAETR